MSEQRNGKNAGRNEMTAGAGLERTVLSVLSVIGPSEGQQRIRERWEPEEYRGFFADVEKVRGILENYDKR